MTGHSVESIITSMGLSMLRIFVYPADCTFDKDPGNTPF